MAFKSAARAPSPAPTISDSKIPRTVTVACKVPNGLVLQLQEKTTVVEETREGNKDRVRFDKVGPRYVVNGPAYPNGQTPEGFPDKPTIIGGYALTPDIPGDFFFKWLEQNKAAPFVVNHMIWAHSSGTESSTRDWAKEHKATVSGFEPLNSRDLDPKKDPRLPGPVPGIMRVSQMNDQDKPEAA